MEESPNNECASGRGGCKGKSVPYGERVASAALESIRKEEERMVDDVSAFIERCEEDGASPIAVVREIAKRSKISISSDTPPEGEEMAKLYHLLRGVVGKCVCSKIACMEEEDMEPQSEFIGLVKCILSC